MEASSRQLDSLFSADVLYRVPLFQRPYVWNKEDNWSYLWEDIQVLLDKHLRVGRVHPHFMGAVVLEQVPNPAGSIESRLVIDGQQRFTTLQVFLIAARNACAARGSTKYTARFSSYVENNEHRVEREEEAFKLLPTNADRAAFQLVHQAKSSAELMTSAKAHPELASSNIIGAYHYLSGELSAWLNGSDDDESVPDDTAEEQRLETLWQVVKSGLQLVVINLTNEDETQVIFETLNARGTPLLPADLIKNFLFNRASKAAGITEKEIEKLYSKHWEQFDDHFWREEVKQGRIKRPRIDLFINHYLSMMTRDEVRSTHLFEAFKGFFMESIEDAAADPTLPKSAAEHIELLARYASIFQVFFEPKAHEDLALFLRRLEAVDTATVYPFLLYAYSKLMPDDQAEFDKVLGVIESFLMRRLIINLTPKNYNRLFVDLIKAVEKSGTLTAASVSEQLGRGFGDSTKFPSDTDLRAAVFGKELYDRIAQRKVRAVLEALDAASMSRKSEALAMPTDLTIEHVMPQGWQTHWPLPEKVAADPVEKQSAIVKRYAALNTLGNLTLITGSFNSSLQNAAWAAKRPELLRYSRMNLTRYFHESKADNWDEDAIEARTEHLFDQLVRIWPGPKASS